jgi:uncharacterized protein (DUF736 family)
MMSTYVQPDNSGSLFKNDKKENDRQPSMKGSAKVNGQEFWVSAWTNTSQKGDKYISFKLEPKDATLFALAQKQNAADIASREANDPQEHSASKAAQTAHAPAPAASQDDEIPF